MPHIACLCGVTLLRAVDDGYGHSLYAAASSRRVTTLVELVGQVGNVQTDFGVFQYRYRRWFEMALLVVRACSRCHHSSLEAIAWLSIIDRQQAWHKQLTFTNDILAADARTWAFVFGPYSLEAPRIVARNLSREAKIRGEFAETLGKTHSSTRIPLPRRGLPKWPRVHHTSACVSPPTSLFTSAINGKAGPVPSTRLAERPRRLCHAAFQSACRIQELS